MIIPINADWRIASDRHCWAVEQRRVAQSGKNAGQESWTATGYYPSLGAAVRGAGELMLRLDGAEGLREAIAAIERVSGELSDALRPVVRLEVNLDP